MEISLSSTRKLCESVASIVTTKLMTEIDELKQLQERDAEISMKDSKK